MTKVLKKQIWTLHVRLSKWTILFCKLIGAICVIPLVSLQRIHANLASSALRLEEKMSDLGAMNQTVWQQCHTFKWIIHQKQTQKFCYYRLFLT